MTPAAPGQDCLLCPRLAAFRNENRKAFPDGHNGPVPSFGPLTVPLLIVGLAPGLKGANRTGRPFTGDHAGLLLYKTLLKLGLAQGKYEERPDDSLRLIGCRIVNAVRCVPPANKPLPEEIRTCNRFLDAELAALANIKAILALGAIAHDAVLRALKLARKPYPFGHGNRHELPSGQVLVDSYHCSRYNTNTGVLTGAMFEKAMGAAKAASLA